MTNKVEELFKDNYALLCLVSFSIVKDRDVAKDIVQDFFVSFWNRRDTLSLSSSFEAYARQSVKNLSLLHPEKEKKQRRLQIELGCDQKVYKHNVEKPKKHTKLNDLLDKIQDKHRTIILSCLYDGI